MTVENVHGHGKQAIEITWRLSESKYFYARRILESRMSANVYAFRKTKVVWPTLRQIC